jgi:trimeric autotransporter adhesin
VLVKLDATGTITDRRTIDAGGSEGVKALAIAPDDSLIALTSESGNAMVRRIDGAHLATDLASTSLGSADARALAVASDGSVAVGGARDGGANGLDGFVTRLSSSLSGAATTAISTSGTDQVDSLAFLNGRLYAGGRTTGVVTGSKTGATDGFVVALDPASGAQVSTF